MTLFIYNITYILTSWHDINNHSCSVSTFINQNFNIFINAPPNSRYIRWLSVMFHKIKDTSCIYLYREAIQGGSLNSSTPQLQYLGTVIVYMARKILANLLSSSNLSGLERLRMLLFWQHQRNQLMWQSSYGASKWTYMWPILIYEWTWLQIRMFQSLHLLPLLEA